MSTPSPSTAALSGAPSISIAQPTFMMAVHQKVVDNESATNWLMVIGVLLLIIGILLQLIFRSAWYCLIWIIGILFLIAATLVHFAGSNLRSCLGNPALCQAMMQVMSQYPV